MGLIGIPETSILNDLTLRDNRIYEGAAVKTDHVLLLACRLPIIIR